MDEEDMAEAEEARKLQINDTFAGLGSAVDSKDTGGSFIDLLRPAGETMGVKLLKKMGWREGQGVGPKIRRIARLEGGREGDPGQTHLFAPENSQMISFNRKNDRKGFGLDGEERLTKPQSTDTLGGSGISDRVAGYTAFESPQYRKRAKEKEAAPKSGFGVGILNDNGSDGEDPYAIGPQISYSKIIGTDKKRKKKPGIGSSTANPLLNSKPVFISKKAAASKEISGFRRCHDGRLPINGFVLGKDTDPLSSMLSRDGQYPPPIIPKEWRSSKTSVNAESLEPGKYRSSADVAAASKLSPKSRAALLGETQLPGKSVFDYLTPNARSRIASASNNQNLPAALSEGEKASSSSHSKTLQSLVPPLAHETALTALKRGTAGWMPYAEDLARKARYRSFLEIKALLRPEGTLPDRAPGVNNDDWVKEMNEFAHAAQIFKPISGMMATRFTSASSAPKLASDNIKTEDMLDANQHPLLRTVPAERKKTPAEEAAALGMYGPLTRSVETFYPTRLLCKRFNVKAPPQAQVDPGDAPVDTNDAAVPAPTHSTAMPLKRLELVGKQDMDDLKMSGGGMRRLDLDRGESGNGGGSADKQQAEAQETIAIDPERNEALEKERPGEAVFKAIFGSDSEED